MNIILLLLLFVVCVVFVVGDFVVVDKKKKKKLKFVGLPLVMIASRLLLIGGAVLLPMVSPFSPLSVSSPSSSSFIGISLVVIGSNNIDGSALSTLGLMACIFSLIGISMSGILQKLYAQNVPLVSGTFYQYLGGALALVPVSLWLEDHTVIMTFELVAAMVWSVLALSVGAILLLMFMIREGEVAKVASYFYLVPPVTVIQTYFLFNETLGIVAITGCLLAVLGVYLVARQAAKNS